MEDHPAVDALGLELRIRNDSGDDLLRALESRRRLDTRPDDSVPLSRAVRIIGGGRKPWGSILSAMAVGDLPFWTFGGTRTADCRRLAECAFIERANIDRYVGIDFDPRPPEGMNFATGVSQRDACEILNLNSLLIRPAVDAGLLSTKRGPANAIMHRMPEVLALARDIVTAAELAPRIGVRENNVRQWIANNLPAVGPAVVGWPRAITLLGLRRIRGMA